MDKFTAMIEWLRGCPAMDGLLNFQAGSASADTIQITTEGGDAQQNRQYIDGSVERYFDYTVAFYKPVPSVPYASGADNANITTLLDVRQLIEWVDAQDAARNYPVFPDGFQVDSVRTMSNEPVLAWVDTINYSPPLAKYTVTIRATYMDYRRAI